MQSEQPIVESVRDAEARRAFDTWAKVAWLAAWVRMTKDLPPYPYAAQGPRKPIAV